MRTTLCGEKKLGEELKSAEINKYINKLVLNAIKTSFGSFTMMFNSYQQAEEESSKREPKP